MRSKIFLELIASELTVAYATQGLIMSEPIKKTKSYHPAFDILISFLSIPFILSTFHKNLFFLHSFVYFYYKFTLLVAGPLPFFNQKDRSFVSVRENFPFFLSLQHQPIPPKYHHTIFYHISVHRNPALQPPSVR